MVYRSRLCRIDRRFAVALAFGAAGCSMHPLPENVSPAATFDIVHRIRCEVAEGLKDLKQDDAFWHIVDNTKIGYDFTFVITEGNDAGLKLQFKRPAFVGEKSFFVELTGSAGTTRKNTRTFRIIEGLAEVKEYGCAKATRQANPLYPITGATGMGEVVRTYIRLELLTDLAKPGGSASGTVFEDALEFTTTLSVGATPTLELSTVAGSLRLSHASFTGSANRTDIHKVRVALTREVDDVDLPKQKRRDLAKLPYEALSRTTKRLVQKETSAFTRIFLTLQRRENADKDRRQVNKILFGTE